ncbi:membrane protein [Nocardiopsis mwathae]|uniref:Membrane protein n=1 Tax=Nocardiopsis mwathae TaxID=1472723 RepID=A0A7W9YDM2_9ACTN|nr:YihY/virulence factor BrkB family protein [Nocardiopsis mwathae]MBB6170025.1 membrane protein [Nocardiopsis mwathae]
MASLVERVRSRGRHYGHLAMESYWAARRRRPAFDHAVRAVERYGDRQGSAFAAAVTYYAFLSFFPLLALAFAAVGYLVEFHADLREYLELAIDEMLPGLSERLPIDEIARARTGAGIIGLLGLLYAGLGSVSSLRQALHQIWLKDYQSGPNIVLRYLFDLAVLVVAGLALVATVALTAVAQAATGWLLSWVGLEGSSAAIATTRLLGLAIAIGMNLLIFLMLFATLSGSGRPLRLLWRGALLAALGFEVLKAAGALLIGGTLGNPVYASFAVVVGLLVWINLVMRLVLFAAAWTATWLAVPPPYQGAVPMGMPPAAGAPPARGGGGAGAGAGGAVPGPGGVAIAFGPEFGPEVRPAAGERFRSARWALCRVALPAAALACAAALAVWVRGHRRSVPRQSVQSVR